MPGIEGLPIRRGDGERRHLAFCEAELLSVVNILPEKCVDFVGIESAGMFMSVCFILLPSRSIITIVAREASTKGQL